MNFVEREKCPLCSCSESRPHMDFPDIAVVRCKRCNFLFSSRIMPAHALAEYYATGFGNQRQLQGQIVNASINAWAMTRMLGRDVASISKILDVGTGYGFFLKHMQDRYQSEVTGVELSEQEAQYGRDILGLDIRRSFLSETDLKHNSFDLVVAFEVIEHIADPHTFVKELTQYVKPNGYLWIITDNFESGVVKSLGAGFPKWIPHTHVSHFAPASLEAVFRESGLEITRRLSFTPWEFSARKLYYQARGIKKSPNEFTLSKALHAEAGGSYKLFPLRKAMNRVWAQMTSGDDLEGALMFLMAKRIA